MSIVLPRQSPLLSNEKNIFNLFHRLLTGASGACVPTDGDVAVYDGFSEYIVYHVYSNADGSSFSVFFTKRFLTIKAARQSELQV